ncbi:MAG: hypothetical protein IT290_07655 [Deltaproteobacteria bacterium]|nr:hypothetical protein [Deltaproteobacteria bacterium]
MSKRVRIPTQILRGSPRLTAELKLEDDVEEIDVERLDAIARQLQNGNLKTREGAVRPRSGSGRILRPGVEQSSSNE